MMLLLATYPAASVFSMKRPIDTKECSLINMVDAHIQYKNDNDAEKLEANTKNVMRHYEEKGKNGWTGFEQEVYDLCWEAIYYFWSQEVTENAIVILDIDETCLSNYAFTKGCNFTSERGGNGQMLFRKDMKCTAIEPMRVFCQALKDLGYKLIYISSRRATLTEATRQNLEREGFHVDELFLMPVDLHANREPSGAWKESVRKELSERDVNPLDIRGCLGDSPTGFEGDYTGDKTILFPNYLYKA